jgi:hypothetical protein
MELGSTIEIADRYGASIRTVHRWRLRPDFPAPLAELRIGPVWDMAAVAAWADRTLPLKPGPIGKVT